ncbi:MAG: DinB family protein [Blastocatellia bacterium]
MSDLGELLIDETRRRLNGFVAQVRTCVEALSEDEIWARADEKSNSIGNLVIHVCGSTRHFLGRGVGGSDYQRNRPAEFTERGPIPRAELLSLLDDIAAEITQTLGGVAPAQLLEVSERTGKPVSVAQLLMRVSHHWAMHTGQIVFDVKARKPGAFEELWIKTLPNL